MRIKSIARATVLTIVTALSSAALAASDFSGNYHCTAFDLQLKSATGNHLAGTLTLNGDKLPATADITGDHLTGSFKSQGRDFPFTADLNGDELKFATGQTTYTLTRPATAQNPLAAPQNPLAAPQNPLAAPAPNPLANPAPAADASNSDVKILATTNTGKTLFISKPNAKSAQAALQATIPDLTKMFGEKPTVTGAFADSTHDTRGGAMFSVHSHGHALRGVILCGGGDKGEAVTVTYASPDAPPTEWATLTAALPRQEKMQTIQFADNSGSVDVPDGWTTDNTTAMGGIVVKGPADQKVTLSQGLEVSTPDSMLVRMHQQAEINARQWGMAPPPPLQLVIAPYTGPVQALQNLVPQLSQFSAASGGPSMTLDKIISTQDAKAFSPNGKAAMIYFSWTRTTNGQAVKLRSLMQLECYPVGQGTWGVFFSSLAAPDTSFDADLATMWAIARSLKVNDQVIAEKTHEAIAASNQRFAAFQDSMKAKNDAFDSFEQSMHNREEANRKSNADFDEVIRGYRTVEDTATGERGDADIGNVHEIVNKLNEHAPGRYKEIPLRDQ